MYGTLNFIVIYIVSDVDPVYGEIICEIKNQETLQAKLVFVLRVDGEWGETGYLAKLCGSIAEAQQPHYAVVSMPSN